MANNSRATTLIRRALEDQGITQTRLAELTGKKTSYISYLLSGKFAINPAMALELERVLGVNALQLLVYQAADELGRTPPAISYETVPTLEAQ